MRVVKKDGTKEAFNVQKVVNAVNKSAFRVLVKFTPEEEEFICKFVTRECERMNKEDIAIAEMHNIETINKTLFKCLTKFTENHSQ